MAYEPKLPEGVTLPPGHSIDANSSRYKELEALATSQKWTQDAFSGVLGLEAKHVAEAHASASAPAAPAPAPAADFAKLSTREQFAVALANSKRTR
jgi:hypothetical protein